jgi:hypothetical protein
MAAHEAKRVEQFEAHLVRTRRCLLGKSNREYPSHSWPHEPEWLAPYLLTLPGLAVDLRCSLERQAARAAVLIDSQ